MKTMTEITILTPETVAERKKRGLWVPMDSGIGLKEVDCGDERPLTEENYAVRNDGYGEVVYPGRLYGGVAGVGVAALMAVAVEQGDTAMRSFVREFSPEGLADFFAVLSDRADKRMGVKLNHHSAEDNELHPVVLGKHQELDTDLGCKFEAALGAVCSLSINPYATNEAKRIQSTVGNPGAHSLVEAAKEGASILNDVLNPDFVGIGRDVIHHAQTKSGLAVPVTILKGHHAKNEDTALVIDFAGYRSNANLHMEAGLPRYHHSPQIVQIFEKLMPEIRIQDPKLLEAASLILATATRLALSGGEASPADLAIEVIPEESAAAA